MAAVVDYDKGPQASLLILLYLEPRAVDRFLDHCIVKVLFFRDIDTAKSIFLNVRCEVLQVIFDFRQVFKLSIISVTFAKYLVVMIA